METAILLKYITCPITKLIFCDPVMAEDGHFYEGLAIKTHLNKHNTSPVTGDKMGSILIKSPLMKRIVGEFIKSNPEYSSEMFLLKKPFYLFTSEFLKALREENYNALKEFSSIVLNTDINRETLFNIICKNCPDDIVKHIIDNSIDYDIADRQKLKPLHIVCKYSSIDVILHLAKKGVDLNSEDINGETPLGYLLLYRKDSYAQMISQYLALGPDINKLNKGGYSPAHYLINANDLDTLKLFVDNKLDVGLMSPKLGNVNLLQYVFRESKSMEIINYMIELNLSLDIDINLLTPSEQLIYQNQHFDKKQKQQLVFQYLTQLLHKPTIIDNYMTQIQNN